MSLSTAARALDNAVGSADEVRILYMGGSFPTLLEFTSDALNDWVHENLSTGSLVLHTELTLAIDGRWENFRFPTPEPP